MLNLVKSLVELVLLYVVAGNSDESGDVIGLVLGDLGELGGGDVLLDLGEGGGDFLDVFAD